MRAITQCKQWKSFKPLIDWFNDIDYRNYCSFSVFDTQKLYPSITKGPLQNTLLFASEYVTIIIPPFKGGTLGSDDLVIFKYFGVIFFLKKKTIQFPISFDLYFQQKRAPKLSICDLPTKRSVWAFDVTNRTNGFSNFQSYQVVMLRYFENTLKSLT